MSKCGRCCGNVTGEGGVSGSLSEVERRPIERVVRGQWLDLASDEVVDEAAMRSWDDSRTIRATVLRDILRGRLCSDADPHGVRIRGACVAGLLDLESLTANVFIELFDCLLPEGLDRAVVRGHCEAGAVRVAGAHLGQFDILDATLCNDASPGLSAEGLRVEMVFLNRATVISAGKTGAMRLSRRSGRS